MSMIFQNYFRPAVHVFDEYLGKKRSSPPRKQFCEASFLGLMLRWHQYFSPHT